jgi:hypothetical protein
MSETMHTSATRPAEQTVHSECTIPWRGREHPLAENQNRGPRLRPRRPYLQHPGHDRSRAASAPALASLGSRKVRSLPRAALMQACLGFRTSAIILLIAMVELDDINRRLKIGNLQAKLALLGTEKAALTREIGSLTTLPVRKAEAMKQREAAHAKWVALKIELDETLGPLP